MAKKTDVGTGITANAEFTVEKKTHYKNKLLSRSVISNAMNELRNHSANVNLAQIYYVTVAEL